MTTPSLTSWDDARPLIDADHGIDLPTADEDIAAIIANYLAVERRARERYVATLTPHEQNIIARAIEVARAMVGAMIDDLARQGRERRVA